MNVLLFCMLTASCNISNIEAPTKKTPKQAVSPVNTAESTIMKEQNTNVKKL